MALVGLEAEARVGGHVTVRLLADERHGHLTLAPQREVEAQTAEHGYHYVDDLGGKTGKLEDGDRFVVDRHTEDAVDDLRHAVIDRQRAKHECRARIEADGLESCLEVAVG
jgi:hypothetical protein